MVSGGNDGLKKLFSNGTGNFLTWCFRVTLLAVFFWFKSEFVTREKYLEDQSRQIEQWTKLTATLTHVDDVLSTLDKHDDDKEKRLRDLERIKK